MANRLAFLLILLATICASIVAAGCGDQVVKAGVPPPAPQSEGEAAGRKNDTLPKTQTRRGGLDLPSKLPKGPY